LHLIRQSLASQNLLRYLNKWGHHTDNKRYKDRARASHLALVHPAELRDRVVSERSSNLIQMHSLSLRG
jgi:hypothetical protein